MATNSGAPTVTTIEQLSIKNPGYVGDTSDPDGIVVEDDVLPPIPFDRRARPQSARSFSSTTSRSSVNNSDGRIRCFDYHASKYFSYRDQAFETAVIDIYKGFFPQSQIDDEQKQKILKNVWLLVDVDHWDLHREVIIFLMENNILIIRYNFIKQRIVYSQTILFDDIRSVSFGPISYPQGSLMGEYVYGGLRIVHGDDSSFFARWNPAAQTNVHVFISHPLAYNDKERETVFYNCDDFIQSLETSLTLYRQGKNLDKIEFVEDKVVINSYASLASVLYNQNLFGFNRDRNGAKW